MFKKIDGLPADVLGIDAVGKVTHQDYRDTFIPLAEAMMAKGPIKMLYVVHNDLPDFELGALWDDQVFGLRHWRDFSRIAVVTDLAWVRTATSLFTPFFPAEVKVFALADLPAATVWISSPAPPTVRR